MDTSASKSKTPERVFRFEYWYLQEKMKQDKIKRMADEKMKNDQQQCTFKPKINTQHPLTTKSTANRSQMSAQSKSPSGISEAVTPTG